ncbi:CoB--CoM heterodisulfide reductase iron-sulfur subunit B family protein [Solidesulfovibrio sp.]|jgi:heterodisulfide reductase subunit B|uniref:CoB--CoM heterodisulfide reductase iron-sulfur subunit B family protein n=1 Tax=Solidesulfovibrio sp. TaxID=2910990 RepID=UPI001859E3D8|nr:CoB--CoM heterodisulfide reductase iron-sulfur subunit B family protein [Solidesulfovibrio sp.]MEA5087841.1 CoB--CoM heterodisulfide reductase iron-sulfur subunit B family protein [Solidesulfovibrio sp.]NMC49283.1 disulfide reductase [Desulfovibrio sp.]HML59313.1 CoB--CoM heterodisulfide reductase iron-sulfur subunit B family protein [Solidesulfovibrio sp.]
MKYAYYPGCSLMESAVEFDQATRAMLDRLEVEIEEIPDWTCCGASAVESVSQPLGRALPARNLALAERHLPGLDILMPCAACYLNHLKLTRQATGPVVREVNRLLADEELAYTSKGGRVRHLLDVLARDVGPEAIKARVARELAGLVVAPYYGCQVLRPYPVFDDPEHPRSMEPIIEAIGAAVHPWRRGNACCGASLMATHKDAALASVAAILRAAAGADVIVTVCSMCQMNLDAYQAQALGHGASAVTVLYLPQLVGLALGLSPREVLMEKNLAITPVFTSKLEQTGAARAVS